ncbi:MAG TPA: M20/M25/M40 family metallo-hydrolase [Nevskiaceae bacterium]|nr:M20/M25/M40 family metallo-hydrolase [Nevskiaceae bacterium]
MTRLAEAMKREGFRVTLQPAWVPHWVRGDERATLVDFPGRTDGLTQRLALTALGGSIATPAEGIRADVLVVHSYDELDARKADAKGKIVLFEVRFDQLAADNGHAMEAYGAAVDYRTNGASAAAKVGAVAELVRSVGGADYRLPHTGAMRYADDAPKIPTAALSAEDADLVDRLAQKGRVTMQLTLTPQSLEPVQSHNLIVDLPGSEKPDEIVLLSGHLDSWDLGTGAIDDGVGVAGALGAIQTIKALKLKPKRTLRAVAWMNEENGLCGALAYAQATPDALRTHHAVVESDSGAGRPLGIYAHVAPSVVATLKPLLTALKAIDAAIVSRRDDEVGADVGQLEQQGVPGFAPMVDTRRYFHYHHTAADTLDKVDPADLKRHVALQAMLAWWLSEQPEMLPRNAAADVKDRFQPHCPKP